MSRSKRIYSILCFIEFHCVLKQSRGCLDQCVYCLMLDKRYSMGLYSHWEHACDLCVLPLPFLGHSTQVGQQEARTHLSKDCLDHTHSSRAEVIFSVVLLKKCEMMHLCVYLVGQDDTPESQRVTPYEVGTRLSWHVSSCNSSRTAAVSTPVFSNAQQSLYCRPRLKVHAYTLVCVIQWHSICLGCITQELNCSFVLRLIYLNRKGDLPRFSY